MTGKPIGLRLLLALPLVLLAALVTGSVLMHAALIARDHDRDQARRTALLVADVVAQSVGTYRSLAGVQQLVDTLASREIVKHVIVAAGHPAVVVVSTRSADLGVSLPQLNDFELAARMAAADDATGISPPGPDANVFARRLVLRPEAAQLLGERSAVVGVRLDPEPFQSVGPSVLLPFAVVTVTSVALVVWVFLILLRRRVFAPLAALERLLQRRRAGERNARADFAAPDEIGDVGRALDAAFDEIDAQQARLGRLARIAQETASAVIVAGPDARIEWVNAAFTRMTGFGADEAIGRQPHEFLFGPGSDMQLARRTMRRLLDGQTATVEMRYYGKDGRPILVAIEAYPVFETDDRVSSIVLLATDVTEDRGVRREIVSILTRFQQDLAYELHDHVGGDLGGLSFRAKALAERLDAEGRPEVRQAGELSAALATVAQRTRTLSRLLAPTSPEQGGLGEALARLLEAARGYCAAEFELCLTGPLPPLDDWQESHVYLIAQEALRNAVRHGQPSRIRISLGERSGTLVLRVTNDRSRWHEAQDDAGLGLRIMRYRAETLGGDLSIRMRAGGITQVRLRLPLVET